MTSSDANRPVPFAPSRRHVMQAAAWSVPVVSLAAATPAFAVSPGPGQPIVTFTSSLFWRPEGAEIPAGQSLYWNFIPAGSVIWITQVINPGTAAVQNVTLDLGVPLDATTNKEFTVLDTGDLPVNPAVFAKTQRASNGRLVVSLPSVPVSVPQTITVAIRPPDSVPKGTKTSWPLTVTPPAGGTTISVPITSYAAFVGSLPPA